MGKNLVNLLYLCEPNLNLPKILENIGFLPNSFFISFYKTETAETYLFQEFDIKKTVEGKFPDSTWTNVWVRMYELIFQKYIDEEFRTSFEIEEERLYIINKIQGKLTLLLSNIPSLTTIQLHLFHKDYESETQVENWFKHYNLKYPFPGSWGEFEERGTKVSTHLLWESFWKTLIEELEDPDTLSRFFSNYRFLPIYVDEILPEGEIPVRAF